MEVFVNTNSVLKVAVSHHPIITDGGEIPHQHLHSTHSAANIPRACMAPYVEACGGS